VAVLWQEWRHESGEATVELVVLALMTIPFPSALDEWPRGSQHEYFHVSFAHLGQRRLQQHALLP
jgi:hypothetical protein